MDHVRRGAIEMRWDPAARLAVLRFEAETHATGDDAAVLIEAMKRWIGTEPKPFGLLGDGGKLAGVDARYRAAWGDFLKGHRAHTFVAFFNMGLVIRIAADMFRLGTGLQLKAFAGEADARAWLRTMGIQA